MAGLKSFESFKQKMEKLVEGGDVNKARKTVEAAIGAEKFRLEIIPRAVDLWVELTHTEFPHQNVRKIDLIDDLIDRWCLKGVYDRALNFISAPFTDREEMKLILMEWKIRVLYFKDDPGCIDIHEELMKDNPVWLPGTMVAFGVSACRNNNYICALEHFEAALKTAVDMGNQRNNTWIQDFIDLARRKIIEKELIDGEEEEKAKKVKRMEAREAKLAERARQKANAKQKDVKKHYNEEEGESDDVERVASVEEGGSEVKEEVPNIEEDAIQAANVQFQPLCSVLLGEARGCGCFSGYLTTNASMLLKSFIEAEAPHLLKLQKLVELCSKNEYLLSIEQAVKNDKNDSTFLVSGESVQTVENYFELKFSKHSPKTIIEWWELIRVDLWIIFRDAIKGLIYLFVNGQASGNVSFNIFVTAFGRGRVLPSLDSPNKLDDLKQLANEMKSIITFNFPAEDLSFLPLGLKDFFDHIDKANQLLPRILPQILLDHPYFWSVGEKIEFSTKLKELLLKSYNLKAAMEDKLETSDLYTDWQNKLTGVYRAIYVYANKPTNNVRQYKKRIDIARYWGSVYVHANEPSYQSLRQNRRLSKEDIERYLISRFPNHYTNMYKCLCMCALQGVANVDHMMVVSTVYTRSEELPTTTVTRTRPETT